MSRSFKLIVAGVLGFCLIMGVMAWRANRPATPEQISQAVAGLTPDQRRQFESVISGMKMSAFTRFRFEPLTRHELREAIEVVTADNASTQIIAEQDAALKRALQNGSTPQK